MNYLLKTILYISLIFFTQVLLATEEYELSVHMPLSYSERAAELKKVTFVTYYSKMESQVSAVTWDPCKSKGVTGSCDLVNPLNLANLKVNLSAYNASDLKHLDGCFVEVDFSKYKPLPSNIRNTIKSKNEKSKLLELAIKSLQLNTQKSLYYIDCELRVKGYDTQTETTAFVMPQYLNPVIPACQKHTNSGRSQAKVMNDKGLDAYRKKNWSESEKYFHDAAEADCSFFIARTNLASVLALQKKYEQAQAVLWRAAKMDKQAALKKLETDVDYRLLKQSSNFYSAASPIGLLYRHYCYKPVALSEVDSLLPVHISNSNLKKEKKYFTVASRYYFEADFNKNGIADKVYPLMKRHLDSLLIVFDGDKLESAGCNATPLHRSDLAGIYKDDPCKLKIYAATEKTKRGIRLETDHIKINRLVCQ